MSHQACATASDLTKRAQPTLDQLETAAGKRDDNASAAWLLYRGATLLDQARQWQRASVVSTAADRQNSVLG